MTACACVPISQLNTEILDKLYDGYGDTSDLIPTLVAHGNAAISEMHEMDRIYRCERQYTALEVEVQNVAIESQVGELRDVYLYSVDDLREIVDQNMRSRRDEACKADTIIDEGVSQFVEEVRSLGALDAVKEYRKMAEQLREQELQRALRSLSRGGDPQQILAQLSRAITNKLIHSPTAGLKQASAEGRQDLLTSACRLLGLESQPESEPTAEASEQGESELPPATVETVGRTLQ